MTNLDTTSPLKRHCERMKSDMWQQMPMSEADPVHEDNSLHGQEKAIRKAYSRLIACWFSWEMGGFFFSGMLCSLMFGVNFNA